MGMLFSRIRGKIYQRPFGGHMRNFGEAPVQRACAAADRTGHAMLHTLYQQSLKHEAEFYVEYFAIDLIMGNDGTQKAFWPGTGRWSMHAFVGTWWFSCPRLWFVLLFVHVGAHMHWRWPWHDRARRPCRTKSLCSFIRQVSMGQAAQSRKERAAKVVPNQF